MISRASILLIVSVSVLLMVNSVGERYASFWMTFSVLSLPNAAACCEAATTETQSKAHSSVPAPIQSSLKRRGAQGHGNRPKGTKGTHLHHVLNILEAKEGALEAHRSDRIYGAITSSQSVEALSPAIASIKPQCKP